MLVVVHQYVLGQAVACFIPLVTHGDPRQGEAGYPVPWAHRKTVHERSIAIENEGLGLLESVFKVNCHRRFLFLRRGACRAGSLGKMPKATY